MRLLTENIYIGFIYFEKDLSTTDHNDFLRIILVYKLTGALVCHCQTSEAKR
jgi:hypothetical protein